MTTPDPKRRSFLLSPDRFVISLLLVICLLWLSDRFQWFGINHHKGWTVLIAVAAVGVAALVMSLWWAVGLIFGRRFQFGIRSVLAFCLACSIAVGWFAGEWKDARRQADVVTPIRNSVIPAFYDWQVDADHFPINNPEPPEPRWLRTMLGDDFFSTVVEIDCIKITDAGLEHFKELTHLQRLFLNGTKITDAGLEHLKELTQLQVLSLNGTKITDAGLAHFKELTQLQTLELTATGITDAGLEHLKGLTQLQVLYLDYINTTDAGLEQLKGLTQLQRLDLRSTRVTLVGWQKLRQVLPNCTIDY